MRLLHTGDWHVGRTIRGRSRLDEFAAALDQVVAIAVEEAVDGVLVAGDIYDQRALSTEADGLVFDTFIRLHDEGIPVVAVPGNHDSAARLEAIAPLLDRIGVRLVCRVRPPSAGGVVEVPARDGSSRALISCLPFVSPRRFATATMLFEDLDAGYVAFDEGMARLMSAYEAAFSDAAVNVVVGHLFVSGAKPGGSERQITLGADHAVSPARLPGTAHYAALGHIHMPQKVSAAPCPTRYCGSLLQLDFGERGQDKSVVVVEAEPGRRAKTKAIPVTAGRELRDLSGTLEELQSASAAVGDAYLRVTVHVDHPIPGLSDRVRDMLPQALDVRLEYERDEAPPPPAPTLDPMDQFISYYRSCHGAEPGEDLLGAFGRVFEEVGG